MDSYLHWGEVVRTDSAVGHNRRVALRLHQPISLQPQITADTDEVLAATA